MQLQEHVAKAELLLEEMELIRALEKVESPMSETQLKEHVMKAGLQLSEMEMGCGKCRLSNVGRLLRPDIVQFHFACLGTEIFLRELTLSSTLSSNPKSSRCVDLQFFHKLLFYLQKFYDKFFIVQRHG